ncbi:MAG: bifunctional diguanylate cyclase/phosphodiesterase [Lachnospiraceae bacterium]|nr:bifunctional diguanylate cyclase/phosphodiesterase [Lachnospiraceae bacterium]
MGNKSEKNTLIIYDCQTNKFTYPESVKEQFEANFDERPLWQIFTEDGLTAKNVAEQFQTVITEIADSDVPQVQFTEFFVKNSKFTGNWYRVGFVCPVPGEKITITFTDMANESAVTSNLTHMSDFDKLTGLLHRKAFTKAVEARMNKDESGVQAGEYAMVYFDVIRFKAINDIFGMAEGDRLLKYIAMSLTAAVKAGDVICRMDADRFVLFTHHSGKELEIFVERILDAVSKYNLPFEVACNVGIYVTNEEKLSVGSMIDRAVLAQSTIKGSYTSKYKYYTESLRNDMLSEQEIYGMMTTALAEKHFVVYYQPQYNHSTGMLVGAEALVRWNHPERGLISPGLFIPIFEKNGFITKLDLYVFEEVCRFIRVCMDKDLPIVPISSNFSRHDIFQPDFVKKLEEIREKHGVPAKYLRVEITESAIMGGSQHANEIVRRLHECGYVVEMDDFGSGYSSLNVLKDIDLDIIKLDMLFLSEETENNKGGTILSSIVRMAKWLGMPVIAEGVEHIEQADFLRSIGCDYIQGYLYSRPLPEAQYLEMISGNTIDEDTAQMNVIDTLNAYDFWNPKSQETLIFSNYVGGAAIFDYRNGQVEMLRVNKKYLQELGMKLSEKDLLDSDPMRFFDEENKQIYYTMLDRAITTGEEQECETWRDIVSDCCSGERMCIRTNAQMIGRSGENCLFFAMIRNITAKK